MSRRCCPLLSRAVAGWGGRPYPGSGAGPGVSTRPRPQQQRSALPWGDSGDVGRRPLREKSAVQLPPTVFSHSWERKSRTSLPAPHLPVRRPGSCALGGEERAGSPLSLSNPRDALGSSRGGSGRNGRFLLPGSVFKCLYNKTKRVSDQEPKIMTGKPKLYYFDGRGRMEPIRWLLGAAGVEFEEEIVETREQFDKLVQDGVLLFQQVPMVEIDGMKLVQTRAILNYIAAKHNLCGKDLKENTLIHMYVEGILDLMRLIMIYPFILPEEQEKQAALIAETATKKYFPVYEKVLKDHGQDFLVGNQFSWADVALLEAILAVEEKSTNVMPEFPQLQSFKERISNLPTIKKFLEPGGQRKPLPDEKYVESVKNVLYMFKNVKLKAGAAI